MHCHVVRLQDLKLLTDTLNTVEFVEVANLLGTVYGLDGFVKGVCLEGGAEAYLGHPTKRFKNRKMLHTVMIVAAVTEPGDVLPSEDHPVTHVTTCTTSIQIAHILGGCGDPSSQRCFW